LTTDAERPQSLMVMCLLSIAVGVIAGLGAWAFRMLIGLFHNLLFLGELNFSYDANVHTPPSPWGAGVILVPVLGAVVVVWLVKSFAPEAKGHGVPEVIDAIHYQGARIRPIVAVVKSVASALCIGSGGSVGREGPIIQIGSAFGSTLGQIVRLPTRQRITLIAAGAGGGIAATFNAPLGGVVFAVELLLVSVSARNLLSVSLATITASYIGRALLGVDPSFNVSALQAPSFHLTAPGLLLLFVPFGVLMGFVSWLFVRGIYWAEDRFDALPVNDYARHMFGMLTVGVMIYLMLRSSGHYYVQGVGYATIMDLIEGKLTSPEFLLLLFSLKLIATCLTLGSGGSGGVFSPGLFLGATAGSLFGQAAEMMLPGTEVSQVPFVLAGMAAGIGGSTGAILTGVVMLTEMTADINVTMPMIVTSAIAYGVRCWLSPDSIYTLKLSRRGHVVPQGLQAAILEAHRLGDVMSTEFRVVEAGQFDETLRGRAAFDGVTILAENDTVVGVVSPDVELPPTSPTGEGESASPGAVPSESFILATRDWPLVEALHEMERRGASVVIIVASEDDRRAADVLGVVSEREISRACRGSARLL